MGCISSCVTSRDRRGRAMRLEDFFSRRPFLSRAGAVRPDQSSFCRVGVLTTAYDKRPRDLRPLKVGAARLGPIEHHLVEAGAAMSNTLTLLPIQPKLEGRVMAKPTKCRRDRPTHGAPVGPSILGAGPSRAAS